MTAFIRCIRSDFYKFRHTSMLCIHLLIPLAVSAMFLAYYSASSWKPDSKISGFLEVIAISFPLIIGLISGKAIDEEGQAGNFQGMLCTIKSRSMLYLSKLIVLLLLGAFSTALAVGTFALGFKTLPSMLYLKAAGILVETNIFIYILHVFISLEYGRGASVGLGIVESLVSALALTGLGDGKWYYISCSWGARLCDYLVYIWANPSSASLGSAEIQKGLLIAFFAICISLLASLIWFRKWEGRKFYD